MQDETDNNELMQRRIELRNQLNYVISILTSISSLGSAISNDIKKAYELIDVLKNYLLGNRYCELVDVFNIKVDGINRELNNLIYSLPSTYERIAKKEAQSNGVSISNVSYFNFSRLNHLPLARNDTIVFDENGVYSIKDDLDGYLNNALTKIENFGNLRCYYLNLNNDLQTSTNSLQISVNTLKINMDRRIEETIGRFVQAERFAIENIPDFKSKLQN